MKNRRKRSTSNAQHSTWEMEGHAPSCPVNYLTFEEWCRLPQRLRDDPHAVAQLDTESLRVLLLPRPMLRDRRAA